ncbi:MAG: hemolysin family protein [Actinomycetota bacterium]|nr:hemolysin family protein [Actinomycetota bacterium]
MSDVLRIVLVLLLVLGNAVFVAAEYALVTARRARLEQRQSLAGRTALRLMDEPVRFIGTVQVAITVFSILLGAVGEPLLSHYFAPVLSHALAFAFSFVILTYLSVVLGELVPKAISLQKAETIAVALALPLDALARLTHPVVWLLQVSANAVTRLFGVEPAPAGMVTHSREDLRLALAEAEETGAIEESEEEMLYKVFDFANKEVSRVMVPRPEVVALSIDLPPEECLRAAIESPYTRYPVYRGSLDDIVGILHVRDLVSALQNTAMHDVRVEDILRPAYMVPETKDLAPLLTEFRRTNQHIAVVVNEYGGMEGIVTLEDVLEEIVGEIEDEFDLPDESIERIDDNTVRIDGTFPIDDFNDQFKRALPAEDFHTMAGFVFGQLGHAPQPGEEITEDGMRLRVVEVEGSRIDRLEVVFLDPLTTEPTVDGDLREAPETAASAEQSDR